MRPRLGYLYMATGWIRDTENNHDTRESKTLYLYFAYVQVQRYATFMCVSSTRYAYCLLWHSSVIGPAAVSAGHAHTCMARGGSSTVHQNRRRTKQAAVIYGVAKMRSHESSTAAAHRPCAHKRDALH